MIYHHTTQLLLLQCLILVQLQLLGLLPFYNIIYQININITILSTYPSHKHPSITRPPPPTSQKNIIIATAPYGVALPQIYIPPPPSIPILSYTNSIPSKPT